MTSDVKLNENNVILEGNVGIGTNNPIRPLHVEGNEIHSGGVGSGFSFDDRKKGNGERWVWYAENGSARLFSQKTGQNAFSIRSDGFTQIAGSLGIGTNNPFRKLHVEGSEIHSGGSGSGFSFADRTKGNAGRWVWYAQDEKARLWSQAWSRDILTIDPNGGLVIDGGIGSLGLSVNKGVNIQGGLRVGTDPISTGITCYGNIVVDSHFASYVFTNQEADSAARWKKRWTWSAKDGAARLTSGESDKDAIVVSSSGNVTIGGALSQASSIALKENIAELSGQEAMATLQGLNAVKYNYKADEQKEQRVGFIAEEVPDLVANSERDRLSPMDLIAVLTKAVQEQQKVITKMADEMRVLKIQLGGLS